MTLPGQLDQAPRNQAMIERRSNSALYTSLIVLSVCISFTSNIIPYFIGNTIHDAYLTYRAARSWQFVGVGGILAAGLFSLARFLVAGRVKVENDAALLLLLLPFSVYLAINAMFAQSIEIASVYTALFFSLGLSISVIRLTPHAWIRILRLVSLLLLSLLLVFVLVKSEVGRYYGAVHGNFIGMWVLVLAILLDSWSSPLRWCGIAAASAVAVVVDSRFSILGMILYFAASGILARRLAPLKLVRFLLSVGILAILVGSVLAAYFLNSGARSLEGGISGRFELWSYGIDRALEQPWLGYGFRNSPELLQISVQSQSGIITMWEELGIFGVAIFLGTLFVRVVTLFKFTGAAYDEDTRRLSALLIGTIMAYISPVIFQPNYLNFGDALGVMMLFVLFIQVAPNSKVEPMRYYGERWNYSGNDTTYAPTSQPP